jgi:hypothetical protein
MIKPMSFLFAFIVFLYVSFDFLFINFDFYSIPTLISLIYFSCAPKLIYFCISLIRENGGEL